MGILDEPQGMFTPKPRYVAKDNSAELSAIGSTCYKVGKGARNSMSGVFVLFFSLWILGINHAERLPVCPDKQFTYTATYLGSEWEEIGKVENNLISATSSQARIFMKREGDKVLGEFHKWNHERIETQEQKAFNMRVEECEISNN